MLLRKRGSEGFGNDEKMDFLLLFLLIFKLSYSWSERKNPENTVIQTVNVEARTGDTSEGQNFKLSYLETLFYSCFIKITFEHLNRFTSFFL